MVELSICVLHYNRWDLTKDCLASIDAQEIPCSYEKVLVDNGSKNSSLLYNPNYAPIGWRLVRYEENRGHIVGQNRCFESAQGEWVLFVANDVRFDGDCISQLWKNRLTYGIIQPLLRKTNGEVDNGGLNWWWPGYGQSHPSRYSLIGIDAFTSTCYLMRKSLWETVGRFDEHLATSHEDIDFSLSAKQKGFEVDRIPSALAIHLGNATLRHQPSHNRAAFHRDRVYVIKKHYRGLDRALRLATVYLLDSLPRP